jgi:thiazole synthase ThiGH ThiG subunit
MELPKAFEEIEREPDHQLVRCSTQDSILCQRCNAAGCIHVMHKIALLSPFGGGQLKQNAVLSNLRPIDTT